MKKVVILFSMLVSTCLFVAGCASNKPADQAPAVSSDSSSAQTAAAPSKKKHHDYKGEKIQ